MYNFKQYIYYTVHTCDIVSFCFCKAVSFCIIIYKLNYSSVSNKMFCSPRSACAVMSLRFKRVCNVTCLCDFRSVPHPQFILMMLKVTVDLLPQRIQTDSGLDRSQSGRPRQIKWCEQMLCSCRTYNIHVKPVQRACSHWLIAWGSRYKTRLL